MKHELFLRIFDVTEILVLYYDLSSNYIIFFLFSSFLSRDYLFLFLADFGDSVFDIDFDIEGKPVALTQKDISYDYSSENGMLHIYIESVHLEYGRDSNEECKGPSSFSTLNSVKAKFSRIFFGAKN